MGCTKYLLPSHPDPCQQEGLGSTYVSKRRTDSLPPLSEAVQHLLWHFRYITKLNQLESAWVPRAPYSMNSAARNQASCQLVPSSDLSFPGMCPSWTHASGGWKRLLAMTFLNNHQEKKGDGEGQQIQMSSPDYEQTHGGLFSHTSPSTQKPLAGTYHQGTPLNWLTLPCTSRQEEPSSQYQGRVQGRLRVQRTFYSQEGRRI